MKLAANVSTDRITATIDFIFFIGVGSAIQTHRALGNHFDCGVAIAPELNMLPSYSQDCLLECCAEHTKLLA